MATPSNQSVIKAFALLNSFENTQDWLSCAELSRRAKLPGASGYRLLQTLEQVGAVIRGARGRYRPSLVPFNRGSSMDGDRLRGNSDDVLEGLAKTLGLTAHLGVLDDGMVTYVVKHGNQRLAPVHTEVGAQLEAYCTGLGKVLLAGLTPAELDEYLGQGDLVALTETTITVPVLFRAEMARVRQQGYAIDDREHCPDLRCVAVPVCDRSGRTLAAVSISGPAERVVPADLSSQLNALRSAATLIGYRMAPAAAA